MSKVIDLGGRGLFRGINNKIWTAWSRGKGEFRETNLLKNNCMQTPQDFFFFITFIIPYFNYTWKVNAI